MNSISITQAELCALHISKQEGKEYKFFRFLTLSSKPSVCFMSEDEQRVITIDTANKLLKEIERSNHEHHRHNTAAYN